MNINYEELIDAFSVASVVYNENIQDVLSELPMDIFSKIDEAVSKSIILGILVAKFNLRDIDEEELNEIINKMFIKMTES